MAAVIAPHLHPVPTRRPVPEPARIPLTVIPGGRQAARAYARQARPRVRAVHPAVYRRRRLGALLLIASLVVVAYLAVTGLGVVLGTGSASATAHPTATASESVVPAAVAPARVYVVQPGDTLWSIARRLHPSGDVRRLVDELSSRAGGGSLQAGQRLSLDGLVD
jgi:hypothetical protein